MEGQTMQQNPSKGKGTSNGKVRKKQKTSAHGGKSVFNRGMAIKQMSPKNVEQKLRSIGLQTMTGEVPAGKFGVLFPGLPTYEPTNAAIKAVAQIMREQSETKATDSPIPLAFAFFGQFIDHDLTLEPVSRFDDRLDPMALTNFRTAALDLDSIYGANPDVARHLYDTYGFGTKPGREHRLPFRLLTEKDEISIDLQRNRQGTAVIGDPRNDENLFISQLHRRIVGFHNEVVKCLEKEHEGNPLDNKTLYEEARKLVTLHYHWIIIHEFLPFIIGKKLTWDILENGRKFYHYEKNSERPFIPVEFGGAAYRFGHTLIRAKYNINDNVQGLDLFEAPFFGVCPLDDCEGRLGVHKKYNLDWSYFLEFGKTGDNVQFCRAIDSSVALPLFDLPFIDASQDAPVSLPERNMRRARTLMIPSGQQVAKAMGIPPLSNKELGVDGINGLHDEAPLWFYILKESELQTGGKHLGRTGGRIVGEVLLGIIEATQNMYFSSDIDRMAWRPKFGENGNFTLKDLVTFKCADHIV